MSDMTSSDYTPDNQERIDDFLARHGGTGELPSRTEIREGGLAGSTKVYAADGYVLLCEWSNSGGPHERRFSEIPPDAKR